MDNLPRISGYDLFAYFASGFSALVGWDLLAGTGFVVKAPWSVPHVVIVVITSYLIGHIVASPAAWILENGFARGYLGEPTDILIKWNNATKRRRRCLGGLWGGYYVPLSTPVASRLQKTIRDGAFGTPNELFEYAHATVKLEPLVAVRMASFLRVYGFCRNMAFTAFVFSLLFGGKVLYLWGCSDGSGDEMQKVAIQGVVSLILGYGMLRRYLKFYKIFCVEILISYYHHLVR